MNAIFKVRFIDSSPQFPRPLNLEESEPWSPDTWSIGSAATEGEATGWARYQLSNISQAAYDAAIADTENYELVELFTEVAE